MKPVVGMTGAYFSEKCSLRVEIVSYEELTNKEHIGLRVLKNMNLKTGCSHEEGEVFMYERDKNQTNGPEGLSLDSII